jgi:predicted membrane channel-forming protein YqfA (hemolysin III family)
MLFSGGFTFSNFLADVLSIFIFVLWFWLLITVFSDLFRRHDISGWAKAIWVIALIVFPYLGIFIYLITQHAGWPNGRPSGSSKRAKICAISSATASPMSSKNLNG